VCLCNAFSTPPIGESPDVPALARAVIDTCDGFRVIGPGGVVGSVEETWLEAPPELQAVVVRLLDGRTGLLRGTDIEAVLPEIGAIAMGADACLLELQAPAPEASRQAATFAAAWRATGIPIELPQERPLWQTVALLYAAIAILVVAVIALAFVFASFVT
jgi:hypothetical protein